ncbi:AMP-binding protein [Saccharothrix sp. 6-C]|uniref:AMP-binding protein n=1 Tax=Saccharothrix sp. 6-C TaxID=2781735 RepID=UPI001917A17A|nr:AMP-binding protein [Saccharothrix sp. 6-C]QQQ78208.1 AMP-binding protein [Saccharothrix sp. 6-C]
MTLLHTILDEAVSAAPDAAAVRDGDGAWTYARLGEVGDVLAGWLRERGVTTGDRVVAHARPSRHLIALMYATSRAGAVFVPLNPEMRSFHLRSVLDNADPRLVVADDDARLRPLTSAEVCGTGALRRAAERTSRPGGRADRPGGVTPDDVALLIYTSGSTATPKAVVSPHAQVVFAASAINEVLGYRPGDVVYSALPLSFDYGLYQSPLCCLGRCELVLGDGADLAAIRRMRAVGATVVPLVPSLATLLTALAGRDPGAPPPVRLITSTGAVLPRATIDALRESFPSARVVRQFGQTECKRITIMPPEQDRERPDSVGLPLPGTAVRVVDADGVALPAGQTGEIVVEGPHLMRGYWREPELTARAFRRDPATGSPRLHTGDYGHLDDDGYLYFGGRRDAVFKRRGARMSTVEIEAAAMDVPGVRAAAVLRPTADRDLTLFVDSDLAPQAVLRELAARLEPAKVPAACHRVADFPLTPHGKHATAELELLLDRMPT